MAVGLAIRIEKESLRMASEIAELKYNLKRESSQTIEALFKDMSKARGDLYAFEIAVRQDVPLFSIVPDLGLKAQPGSQPDAAQ